jgi:outer membrane protein
MNRIHLIVIFLLVLSFRETSAQEKKWTLEDCISYAVTNNISLRRQMLQTETAEVNFLKSKMDVLPSLNFGSDARIGFGRSIDPVTNLITFKQNISNSYSLNSNVQLFTGFTTLNTISANKFMLKAGLESEKIVRNTLVVEILGQYYQILYARGLEDASKAQLELSEYLKWWKREGRLYRSNMRWRARCRPTGLIIQSHIILPVRLLQCLNSCFSSIREQILIL